jgi:hypothetical protein
MEFSTHFPTRNSERRNRNESFDFTEYDKYYEKLKDMAKYAERKLAENEPAVTKIISTYAPDDHVTMEEWVKINQALCLKEPHHVATSLAQPQQPPSDNGDDRRRDQWSMSTRLRGSMLPDYSVAELRARQHAYFNYQIRMSKRAFEKAHRAQKWADVPVVFGMTSITVLAVGATMVTVGIGIFVVPYLSTPTWVMLCSKLTSPFHVRCFVGIFRGFGFFTESEYHQILEKFNNMATQLTGVPSDDLNALVTHVFSIKAVAVVAAANGTAVDGVAGNGSVTANGTAVDGVTANGAAVAVEGSVVEGVDEKYHDKSDVLAFFRLIRTIVDGKKFNPLTRLKDDDGKTINRGFMQYIFALYNSGHVNAAITALSIGKQAYGFVQISLDAFRKNPDANSMLIYKQICTDLVGSLAADSVFHESALLLSQSGTNLLDYIIDVGKITQLQFIVDGLSSKASQEVLIMLVKQPIKDYATRPIRAYFAELEPKNPEPAVTSESMMVKIEKNILLRRKYRKDGLSDDDIEQLLDPPYDDKSPDRYKLLPVRRLKQFARKFRAYAKNPATLVSAMWAVFTLNTVFMQLIGAGLTELIVEWQMQVRLFRRVPGAILELAPSGLFHHKFSEFVPTLADITAFMLRMFVGGDEAIQYKINEQQRLLIYKLIVDLNRLVGEIYGELTSMIRQKARGTILQAYIVRLNDCVLVRVFSLVCTFIHAVYEVVGVPYLVFAVTQRTPTVELKLHALIADKDRMVRLSEFVSNTTYNTIKHFARFEWVAVFASVKKFFDHDTVVNRVVAFIDANDYIQTTPLDQELVGSVVTLTIPNDQQQPPPGPVKYIITAFDGYKNTVEMVELDDRSSPLFDPMPTSDMLQYYLQQFLEEDSRASSASQFKDYLLSKLGMERRSHSYLEAVVRQLTVEVGDDDQRIDNLIKQAKQRIDIRAEDENNEETPTSTLEDLKERAESFLKSRQKGLADYANDVQVPKTSVTISFLINQNPQMRVPSLRYNHLTGLFDYRIADISTVEYFDVKLLASMAATNAQMNGYNESFPEPLDSRDSLYSLYSRYSRPSAIYDETKVELSGFIDGIESIVREIKILLTDDNKLLRFNHCGFDYGTFGDLVDNWVKELKVGDKAFKVGDVVRDDDGDLCVIHSIDISDTDQPYEVKYLTGAHEGKLFWSSKSKLTLHPLQLDVEQKKALTQSLQVDVYEKKADKSIKIFANPTRLNGKNVPPTDTLTGLPVDLDAFEKGDPANLTYIEARKLLYTPQAISALAISTDESLGTIRAMLSKVADVHLGSFMIKTIQNMRATHFQNLSPSQPQSLSQFQKLLMFMEQSSYLKDSLHESMLAHLRKPATTDTILTIFLKNIQDMTSDENEFENVVGKTGENEVTDEQIDDFWETKGFDDTLLAGLRVGNRDLTVSDIKSTFFPDDVDFGVLASEFKTLEGNLQLFVDSSKENKNKATLDARRKLVQEFIGIKRSWFELNRKIYMQYRAQVSSLELERNESNLRTHYNDVEKVLRKLQDRVGEWRRKSDIPISMGAIPTETPPPETPQSIETTPSTETTSNNEGSTSGQLGTALPDADAERRDAERRDAEQRDVEHRDMMLDTAIRTKEDQMERIQAKSEQEPKSMLDESLQSSELEEQDLKQHLDLSSIFASSFSNLVDGFAQLFSTTTPNVSVSPMVPTAPVQSNLPEITEETSEEQCRRIAPDWFMAKRTVKTLNSVREHSARKCSHRSLMDRFLGVGVNTMRDAVSAAIASAQLAIEIVRPWLKNHPIAVSVLMVIDPLLLTASTLVACMHNVLAFTAVKYIELYGSDEHATPDIMVSFLGVYLVHAVPYINDKRKGLVDLSCDFVATFFGKSMSDITAESSRLLNTIPSPHRDNYNGKPSERNIHGYVNKGYQKTMLELAVGLAANQIPITAEQKKTLNGIQEKASENKQIECSDYKKLNTQMLLQFLETSPQAAHVWAYFNCQVFSERDPQDQVRKSGEDTWFPTIYKVHTLCRMFVSAVTDGIPFIGQVVADLMENESLRGYVLDELLGQPSHNANVNVGRDLFDTYFANESRGELLPAVLLSLKRLVKMVICMLIETVLRPVYQSLGETYGEVMIQWLNERLPGYGWERARDRAPAPPPIQVPEVLSQYQTDPNVIHDHRFIQRLFADVQRIFERLEPDSESRRVVEQLVNADDAIDEDKNRSALNNTVEFLEKQPGFDGEYAAILRHYIDISSALSDYMKDFKHRMEKVPMFAFRVANDSKDEKMGNFVQLCESTDISLFDRDTKQIHCILRQTSRSSNDSEHKKTFDDAFRKAGTGRDVADSLVRLLGEHSVWFIMALNIHNLSTRPVTENITKKSLLELLGHHCLDNDATCENIKRLMASNYNVRDLTNQMANKLSEFRETMPAFVRAQFKTTQRPSPEYAAYLYAQLYDVGTLQYALKWYKVFDSLSLDPENKARSTELNKAHPDVHERSTLKRPDVARAIQMRLYDTLLAAHNAQKGNKRLNLPDTLVSADQPFYVTNGVQSYDLLDSAQRMAYLAFTNGHEYPEGATTTVDLQTLNNEFGYFLYPNDQKGVSVHPIAPRKFSGVHEKHEKYTPKTRGQYWDGLPPILFASCKTNNETGDDWSCIKEHIDPSAKGNATFDFIRAMYVPHRTVDRVDSVMYVLKSDDSYHTALLRALNKTSMTKMKLWDDLHARIANMRSVWNIPTEYVAKGVNFFKGVWAVGELLLTGRVHKPELWDSTSVITPLNGLFDSSGYLNERIGFSMSDKRVFGMAYDSRTNKIFTKLDDHILTGANVRVVPTRHNTEE